MLVQHSGHSLLSCPLPAWQERSGPSERGGSAAYGRGQCVLPGRHWGPPWDLPNNKPTAAAAALM